MSHMRMRVILDKERMEVKPGYGMSEGMLVRAVVRPLFAFLGLMMFGCAALAPVTSTAGMGGAFYIGTLAQRWEEVVRTHPLGPDEQVKGLLLSDRPAVSHVVVQIRGREQLHIHQEHDVTIVMLRGTGRLALGDRVLSLRAGDTVLIPRGTPHYYLNEGREPTVVLAIFTPSYDGKDAVVVPSN
jgi:mannose-6-phosphate isomerase-like protein (cupin superfamily)